MSIENTGQITTTDAIETILVQMDLPQDSGAVGGILVIARESSNGAVRTWKQDYCAKRFGSGDGQIDPALTDTIVSRGDSGTNKLDVNVSFIGATLTVSVTGLTGQTIKWLGVIDAQIIAT